MERTPLSLDAWLMRIASHWWAKPWRAEIMERATEARMLRFKALLWAGNTATNELSKIVKEYSE